LIETTNLRLITVATRVGFGSEERLRRSFQRTFGIAPKDYRERFQAAS
jgi:transcriptional regulator GlxA family with amidase domain